MYPPIPAADRLPTRWLAAVQRAETRAVEQCVLFARRNRLMPAARFFTRMGNGWLYSIASALLLLTTLPYASKCVLSSAVSLAIALMVYPLLKHSIGRRRPCDVNGELADACQPLDRYSCPSGHAMTAAAFGVPIIIGAPAAAAPLVIAGWLLVSWSRMALGHHYFSDLIAGTAIGVLIAGGVSLFIF